MKVKDLRALLQQLPDDANVFVSVEGKENASGVMTSNRFPASSATIISTFSDPFSPKLDDYSDALEIFAKKDDPFVAFFG